VSIDVCSLAQVFDNISSDYMSKLARKEQKPSAEMCDPRLKERSPSKNRDSSRNQSKVCKRLGMRLWQWH
jgi:hypothetical protein